METTDYEVEYETEYRVESRNYDGSYAGHETFADQESALTFAIQSAFDGIAVQINRQTYP